jgi:DNA primase
VDLTELIESIDILDYISQYAEFTEKGGEYWALSPLKEESTPSFSVRRESGSFFDFSTGIGGNVLTFVRYHDHCGYGEAIKKLQDYLGVDGTVQSTKRLSAVEVAKRFSSPPKSPKREKQTVLPGDYMERYEKRPDKLAVWLAEGISQPSLDRFNVRYDGFSDRLVYPIREPTGKIVNVGGRTLDPDWKAKKLRKYTYFFSWGEMTTIYGLAENLSYIRDRHEIILFEGCKSVLLADTWGIRNTGAILTSHLNQNQAKLLIGLGCRVVFALDKDVRVRDDRNIRKLKQFVNVEYICDTGNLLGEKDSPVDRGLETWKTLYEGRLTWS